MLQHPAHTLLRACLPWTAWALVGCELTQACVQWTGKRPCSRLPRPLRVTPGLNRAHAPAARTAAASGSPEPAAFSDSASEPSSPLESASEDSFCYGFSSDLADTDGELSSWDFLPSESESESLLQSYSDESDIDVEDAAEYPLQLRAQRPDDDGMLVSCQSC